MEAPGRRWLEGGRGGVGLDGVGGWVRGRGGFQGVGPHTHVHMRIQIWDEKMNVEPLRPGVRAKIDGRDAMMSEYGVCFFYRAGGGWGASCGAGRGGAWRTLTSSALG